jgi:hypothetical protein
MAINKHTSYTCKKNPDNTYSLVVKCRVNGKDVDATGTLTQTELESLAATHVKVDCQNGLRGQADTPNRWWYGAEDIDKVAAAEERGRQDARAKIIARRDELVGAGLSLEEATVKALMGE